MTEVLETLESRSGCTEVLAEGVDEHGPWIRFRHRTRHRGRMAGPHWHPVLAERFSVEVGALRFRLDGGWRTLGPGESVSAVARAVHEFRHDSEGEVVFWHEVRPPGNHRAMFQVMHALDATGRLTAGGFPRNPLALGLLWGLQDGYVVGPPPRLQDVLLGGLDRLARRLGHHRRLAAAVGRDETTWDRPAAPAGHRDDGSTASRWGIRRGRKRT